MIENLKRLNSYRELLILWTQREIRIRYKQSALGVAWAILQPLVLMFTFTTVFSLFARIPSDGVPYPLFSYTALLVWTLLSSSISFGIPTLVNNMSLVTKIYFPREILPMASIGAAFVDFLIAAVLLLGVLIWYQTPVTPAILWLPVVLSLQILLIVGIVIPASALNVFYRDIRFLVPLATQLWMYASPVIYPISLVPERWRPLYALNPMVGIVDSYRRTLLQGEPPNIEYLTISACVSVLFAVAGYAYFKRSEPRFADLI